MPPAGASADSDGSDTARDGERRPPGRGATARGLSAAIDFILSATWGAGGGDPAAASTAGPAAGRQGGSLPEKRGRGGPPPAGSEKPLSPTPCGPALPSSADGAGRARDRRAWPFNRAAE